MMNLPDYSIDLERMERLWQPSTFVVFMESNIITRLFWRVIAFCCGYDNQYRCCDWKKERIILVSLHDQMKADHQLYRLYVRALANYNYYNPSNQLYRGEFMSNPIQPSPFIFTGSNVQQGLPSHIRQNHVRQDPLRGVTVPVPPPTSSSVPLQGVTVQVNPPPSRVPGPTISVVPPRNNVPLSQQNNPIVLPTAPRAHSGVPGPTTGTAGRSHAATPLSRAGLPVGNPDEAIPLSQQNTHRKH